MDLEIKDLKKLYESIKIVNGVACVYCGLLATDKEHIIPRAFLKNMRFLRNYGIIKKYPKIITAPSCRECNLIASDKVFNSFIEKKKYIREKLLKKYRKFETFKPWTDEEINELSGRLREHVFIFNEVAKIMKKRFDFLKKEKENPILEAILSENIGEIEDNLR